MSITMLSDVMLPWMLDAAAKGTIMLLLAFCVARFSMQTASAGSRHLLWASSMIGLLMLPFLSLVLPAWRLPVSLPELHSAWLSDPAPSAKPRATLVGNEVQREAAEAGVVVAHPAPLLVASRDAEPPRKLFAKEAPDAEPARPAVAGTPLALWVLSIWLAGVVICLPWLAAGWFCLTRLTRGCQRATDSAAAELLAELAGKLGIRRPVRLLLCGQRAIPMTWGLRRPVVLLPNDYDRWRADRLRMVLIHELAHIQRWDCLVQMLAHLARGIFWFHPLAWLAVRQLRMEQEQACDDVVLASGASAPDYAEHLVVVTTGLAENFWTAPVALGMGREAKLRQRLMSLLDSTRNHRPVGRTAFLVTAAATLLVSLILGTGKLAPTATAARPGGPRHLAQAAALDKDAALLRTLHEVQQKLGKHYVSPVDQKALAEHALKGLLQGLKDPYTDYLSADELAKFDTQLQGALVGIGVQIKSVDSRITVVSPTEDSPALKAGLRPGDVIEAIDGKSTTGQTLAEVIPRILGAAGTVVKLKVVHPEGVVEELAIPRGEIRLRSISGFQRGSDGQWQFLIDPDHKIGYLDVYQFSVRTAAEVRETVADLQKQGLKGLILDLRFCPGGLLHQGIDVCKLFLAKGVIVTTKGPGKDETVYQADRNEFLGDFPLIVLVNDETASAAEIVAGALRDHDRAVLLGTRTFGKGSVQSVMKLDAGGALKVTTAFHYLPSGRNIQKRPGEKTWGVDPTDGYYVPVTAAQIEAMRADAQKRALLGLHHDELPKIQKLTPKIVAEKHADPQLAAALRSMVARITGGEFLKVGKDHGLMLDHLQQIEELRQRREQLQRHLKQLDQDIHNLQTVGGTEKGRNK